jgi:metallo-beta-lactamase family protein
MDLTIWGAAQQVTGSMHLLELKNYKILIDCGLDYEKGNHQEQNLSFPFEPHEIDLVILTHAHIDHSGNLPTLIRMGYDGQILCTGPTADLTEILLVDSVNIFLNKQKEQRKAHSKRRGGPQPLYLQKHVMETVDRFVTIGFHKPFRINGDIELTFIPVGHLLGAAAAVFYIKEDNVQKSIAFSGDIGRAGYPVLIDPETLPPVDYLVCESTYGGKTHSSDDLIEDKLVKVISETCIKNPGRLIIPAFSIGRTQSLIFKLNQIFSKGLLPPVEVFVDSPLANFATEIYRKHHQYVSEEAKDFYASKGDEFDFDNLTYLKTQKESLAVSNYLDPCIIISFCLLAIVLKVL